MSARGSFPKLVRHGNGHRVIWWESQWHTPAAPDTCYDDFATAREADAALQEYWDERADEARERGAEEAYEAERAA